MKLYVLSWIVVSAVPLYATAHSANEQRKEDIIDRCIAIKNDNEWSQLQACNPFLRTELGCLLPAENLTMDRSCLDKKLSERVYQSCIDDQGFWGHPIEPKEGNDRLITLSRNIES
jgi:hypothetical protein